VSGSSVKGNASIADTRGWRLVEGAGDDFDEGAFFTEDETPGVREGGIDGASGVPLDASLVPSVGRGAVEGDQAPGDVVGPFVGKKVAHELAPTVRNDAAPVFGVWFDRVALEWIDRAANHTHHFEFHGFPPLQQGRLAHSPSAAAARAATVLLLCRAGTPG
jgi:hypothetical protein